MPMEFMQDPKTPVVPVSFLPFGLLIETGEETIAAEGPKRQLQQRHEEEGALELSSQFAVEISQGFCLHYVMDFLPAASDKTRDNGLGEVSGRHR